MSNETGQLQSNGHQSDDSVGEIRFPKSRWAMARSLAFCLVVIGFALSWLSDPGEFDLFSRDVPDPLAFLIALYALVFFTLAAIRAGVGLAVGAPGVVLNSSGVLDRTPLLGFPRSHSFARWDEIIAARRRRWILLEELVVELRTRRPIRITLNWLTDTDAARLHQEISTRLARLAPEALGSAHPPNTHVGGGDGD